MESIGETELTQQYDEQIQQKVRRFCRQIGTKWQSARRTITIFRKKFNNWLELDLVIQKPINTTHLSAGRPHLSFEEKSSRSQRRDATQLSKETGDETLLLIRAASASARKKHKTDIASVLKEVTKSPSRPSKIKHAIRCSSKSPIPYTPEEALAFMLDNNLSKRQYMNIRLGAKMRNCDIYPPYSAIVKAKSNCRVKELVASDTQARIPLSKLLEHTCERVVHMQDEVIREKINTENSDILHAQFIFSYGFDGSSGHSVYNQQYLDPETPAESDSNLFATTVVPLRLITNDGFILWNNQTPQSSRYCRPLKLEFVKESKDVILKEKYSLEKEIRELRDLVIDIPENKTLKIQFKLYLTIIDGKVLNFITGTDSFQKCPICKATPKDFLQIKDFKSEKFHPTSEETLQHGISPLHSWIRFFECLLHLSYKLEIKQWAIRGSENKSKVDETKKNIQRRFWNLMKLHVDKPRPGGIGNSNDGNTSRRAFSNPELFSQVTGIDQSLINNFRTILIALSCQYPLDLEKFEKYCFSTATCFMENYPWCPMTPSVHKVLIHSKQILENSVLPVGYFGEDAAESRNKLYKQDRLSHSRQNSRINNITDMFNRAMDTSDPLISSISLKTRIKNQSKQALPSEVRNLLLAPEPVQSTSAAANQLDFEEMDTEGNYDEDETELELDFIKNLELDNSNF